MTPLRAPPTNFIKTNIKIDNNVPLTSNKWSLWHYKPFNRTPLWGRAYVNISVVGLSLVFIANRFSKEHVEVAQLQRPSTPLYSKPSYETDNKN